MSPSCKLLQPSLIFPPWVKNHPNSEKPRCSEPAGKRTAPLMPFGVFVWSGCQSSVLCTFFSDQLRLRSGGVTIGSGAVIGAGSVVTSDIKPGWSAFGVPARQHRSLTELSPEPVSGHFETLQDTLNDGGLVDAVLREQPPREQLLRARRSTTNPCEKHDERILERSAPSTSSPTFKTVALSVIVLMGLFIFFLIGVLFGSKRMAFAFGREEATDSL